MPRERNAFKLGLALIVFGTLFVVILVFLAPKGKGDLQVQVRFPHSSITGSLKSGGEVKCGGKTVGYIRSVDLRQLPVGDRQSSPVPATSAPGASGAVDLYTVVTIVVDSDLGLCDNMVISPVAGLLGGLAELVIHQRGDGKPLVQGQTVEGTPGGGIMAQLQGQLDANDASSFVGKLHAVLNNIIVLSESLRTQLDAEAEETLLAKIHTSLDDINAITTSLSTELDASVDLTLLSRLHRALGSVQDGLDNLVGLIKDNREPLTQTIANVQSTSIILEQQIATRIAQQLDVNDAASLMAKIHVGIDQLNSALLDIKRITAGGREAFMLSKDQIARMIDNLKTTSDHLKAASKDVRRNPWRLLYQPTLAQAEFANTFDAAREFSEAAVSLDDVVVRLQAIVETDLPEPIEDPKIREILEQLEEKMIDFSEAENALWEQLNIR